MYGSEEELDGPGMSLSDSLTDKAPLTMLRVSPEWMWELPRDYLSMWRTEESEWSSSRSLGALGRSSGGVGRRFSHSLMRD